MRMGVNFKIPLALQAKAMHKDVVRVDGRTLAECLEDLIHRYPQLRGEILDDNEKMLIKWMVSINSTIVARSDDLTQSINAEDIIELLPLIAGG
jgi:molybdopterin converting factor small subunit